MFKRYGLLLLIVTFAYADSCEDGDAGNVKSEPVNRFGYMTICLNMIVKNESPAIQRCLASVKPLIDYWVIVDTGSTDGTQQIIREFMRDIPGELYERPWVDFAHNRNEALSLAKNRGDYILFIDADETLVFSDAFVKPPLDKDAYFVTVREPKADYQRILLINSQLHWKWQGVVHETIDSSEAKSSALLKDVVNLSNTSDGYRSRDPQKYLKDAQVLEKALANDPSNSRYVFYLAQSYMNGEKPDLALKAYEQRAAMGGWDQEVFWSLHQIGILQETLQMPAETCISSYCKAYQYRPSRAEPLYYLARNYLRRGNHILGYLVTKFALSIPLPHDNVFIQHWIYDYGLLLEFANCAYWLGKHQEAQEACEQLLAKQNLPPDIRSRVEQNLLLLLTEVVER